MAALVVPDVNMLCATAVTQFFNLATRVVTLPDDARQLIADTLVIGHRGSDGRRCAAAAKSIMGQYGLVRK